MPTVLPLSRLVDLALGTPEVGAVNFNVLHTLLHAMITKLNLNDIKAEINDSDRDFLSSSKPQRVLTAFSDIDSGKGEDSEDALSEFRDSSETDSTPVPSATRKSKRPVPYHHLELRVEKLAEQLESLNALPSTSDLLERAKAKGDGERPVAEMWQYMQLKKRVDANEDGVGKLMSLIEDLMKEMQVLRDANADLLNKINSLDIDDLKKKLAELEKITNDLNDKFSTLPTPEEYAQFVTWPLLEDSLKGVRKDMEGLSKSVTPAEKELVESAIQTDPKVASRPPSSHRTPSRPPSSRSMSRLSNTSSGPTDHLLDVLERLGKLSEDHDSLAKRVKELEDQLKNKLDKDALENLTQELTALQGKFQDLQPVVHIAQKNLEEHTQTPPSSPQPSLPIPTSPSPPPKSPSPIQKTPESQSPTPEIVRTPSPVTESPSLPPKSPTPPPKSPSPPPKLPSPTPKSPSPPPFSPDPPVQEPSSFPPTSPPIEAIPPVVISHPEPVDQLDVTSDLSSDLLEQLNKLKEEMDALQAMREKQEKEDKVVKVQSSIPKDLNIGKAESHIEKAESRIEKAESKDLGFFDREALLRTQQAIPQLQVELEKVQTTTKEVITENQHRSKQIESLLKYCDTLQEKKADKEHVAMEVDVKADKRQLENKVNHSLFDSTTGEINRLVKEILDKLDGQDSGWKDAFKELAEDVEGKLDRLEIEPLKEWLENRLKALNKKIMANAHQEWGEDDAAGLRKQLIQRFNCLSCDRPVDLMPTGPVPSLPSQNALPSTRSPRPYTTYELEQIRQHAKSGMLGKNLVNFERALAEKEMAKMRRADLKAFLVHFGQDIEVMARRQQDADFNNQDVSDYYATMRQCGGSHTLTYPHKRVSRMTQMNNLFKDEVEEHQPTAPVYPVYKEEVDVQGVDGHIYRGRMERVQIEAKMPSKMTGGQQKQTTGTGQRLMQKIPQTESVPFRNTPTPPLNMRGRPMSARGTSSPRPSSGRPMSRPQSRPVSARHSGQESSRTTPFQDDSYNQTDGADQGQTTVVEAEAIRVDVPTPDILEEPSE